LKRVIYGFLLGFILYAYITFMQDYGPVFDRLNDIAPCHYTIW
jgi:hypothetical protein